MELTDLKLTARRYGYLVKMGITDLESLLKTYPFRYEKVEALPFSQWQPKDHVAFEGLIASAPVTIPMRGKGTMTRFTVLAWNEEIQVTVFNRPWANQFPFGKQLSVTGIYQGNNRVTALSASAKPLALGLHPVYSITKGMHQYDMQAVMKTALQHTKDIPDVVPARLRQRYRLLDHDTSYQWIHNPPSMEHLRQAVRTLKYEEFLRFQCALQAQNMHALAKEPKRFDTRLVQEKLEALPFELTPDQKRSIDEILDDMHADVSMVRMLQGDVGCGKTVVAMAALYAASLAGCQACILAPTEILARQHAANLNAMGLPCALLASGMKTKEKREVLEGLASGDISVVAGTHALFQESVQFSNLGLVVADEQQRFGVDQRRKLLAKGVRPDFLMMTATPIPRTYAHFLYGDISMSAIHTMPAGRKPVLTKYVPASTMKPILKEVLTGLKEGRQCYVVCPAIDENLETNLNAVISIYEGMEKILGKDWNIGLLHGRMSPQEKDDAMLALKEKRLDILVSTTVIEVGIDVADATMMVIYDAHRFGLSTIHQLRGRCARGKVQGKCWLLSDSKDAAAIERLKMLEHLDNGFDVSAYDLKTRGPGDLLGTRQSGLPAFVLGDFEKDPAMMEAACQDAKDILKEGKDTPMLQYVMNHSGRYTD
jgi:ATP-dependent DNA helicase RecG